MPPGFQFEHELAFSLETGPELLRQIPALPGVFALRGERATDEPYLTRAADLRRRLTRLLAPPEPAADGSLPVSKRLNLRSRVHSIAWTLTGSEFESTLLLYEALAAQYGFAQARRRMRLYAPYFVRFTATHRHPRLYTTNRLSRRGLAESYGPFPSRTAAERYADAVLDLYKLRRCWEELEVHPDHPGCAYGEMKRCLAPCNLGCSEPEYSAEAAEVKAFLDTHGESMLARIATAREQASEAMDFEQAAALHTQYAKVKAAAALADELVRPLPELRAVVVQRASTQATIDHPDQAAIFLLEAGCLAGPARLSTLGVRAVKEQTSVGSSLFAQPLMLQAIPLEGSEVTPAESPETRCEAVLTHLAAELPVRTATEDDLLRLADHLSLFRRWYYRPEKQRQGEAFLPNPDGSWPVRRILRGAARIALGDPKPMAATDRDAAPAAQAALKNEALKTRILHEGRPDVERVITVLGKSSRRKRVPPANSLDQLETK